MPPSNRTYCSKACEGLARNGANNSFYAKRHSKETIQKILTKIHARPNLPEQKLIALFAEHKLPFRYTGDGSETIAGVNPDFVHANGKRKVIEFFGRVFHDPDCKWPLKRSIPLRQTEKGRKALLCEEGYELLVIWEEELKDSNILLQRVMSFEESNGNYTS